MRAYESVASLRQSHTFAVGKKVQNKVQGQALCIAPLVLQDLLLHCESQWRRLRSAIRFRDPPLHLVALPRSSV